MALRALSCDAGLLRGLQDEEVGGRVHSVFARVVNVTSTSGCLFSLASRDVDNAPDTLIVDVESFPIARVLRGQPVVAVANRLSIGDRTTIDFGDASAWRAVLIPYPADDSRLRDNLALLRAQLEHYDAGDPRDGERQRVDADAWETLGQHQQAVFNALKNGDVVTARRHCGAMIGLGPGLTPSGDDFLVGLLAVLNIPESPCGTFASVGADIAIHANHCTNDISAAALAAAASGRVRESIGNLLRDLMHGTSQSAVASLSAVLAIGSTSGRDIVAGIVCGFETNLRFAGRIAHR